MQYWYGFTGEALVLGYGRAIRGLIDSKQVGPLHEAAKEQSARNKNLHAETYIAALVAAFAMKRLDTQSVQTSSFSSAAEIIRLFAGLTIEQVVLNFWNGRIACTYADAPENAIAGRIEQSLQTGKLLALPRDASRLHSERITNELPGALSHLLARANAEKKAFTDYLRRGTPPIVTTTRFMRMTKSRVVQCTWAREAQIEWKGPDCEHS